MRRAFQYATFGLLVAALTAWGTGTEFPLTGLTNVDLRGGNLTCNKLTTTDEVVTKEIDGDNTIVLADTVAETVFTFTVPTESAGGGSVFYTLHADDGTNFQCLSGIVVFAAVNESGTSTMSVQEGGFTESEVSPTGTLTADWTYVDGGNGAIAVQLESNSSVITPTTVTVTMLVIEQSGLSISWPSP